MQRSVEGVVVLLFCGWLAVGTGGCSDAEADEPAVALDWTLQPDPPRVGPATLTLTLSDSAGRPITAAAVEVEANMAHPGMPPVFADVAEADAGRYVASLAFSMAGDWVLLVDAAVPGGPTIERRIDVRGVQSR